MTTEQHAREVLTPAQIAVGLTKAQREALVRGHGFSVRTFRALVDAELITGFSFDGSANSGWVMRWTDLGLSVRQHLLEQDAEGRR